MSLTKREQAVIVVRALTDAAVQLVEIAVNDEAYMRDLDDSKVDAVFAVLGKPSRSAKLVKAVLKSQAESRANPNQLKLK